MFHTTLMVAMASSKFLLDFCKASSYTMEHSCSDFGWIIMNRMKVDSSPASYIEKIVTKLAAFKSAVLLSSEHVHKNIKLGNIIFFSTFILPLFPAKSFLPLTTGPW